MLYDYNVFCSTLLANFSEHRTCIYSSKYVHFRASFPITRVLQKQEEKPCESNCLKYHSQGQIPHHNISFWIEKKKVNLNLRVFRKRIKLRVFSASSEQGVKSMHFTSQYGLYCSLCLVFLCRQNLSQNNELCWNLLFHAKLSIIWQA